MPETIRINKDGEVVEVAITNALVRDEADRPIGFISIHTDISPLKNLERRLREQNQELAEAIDSRMSFWPS